MHHDRDDSRSQSPIGLLLSVARSARETILSLKGSSQWRAWFEELAVQSRLNKSILIDLALADYAKKIGFLKPPPKR
jgi:hypothetical protein